MLPDPSTIVPLDAEEFMAAHQYAGMVMENEFLEEVPTIGKALIRTPDGTFGFNNHPLNLFCFALLLYFRVNLINLPPSCEDFFGLGPLLKHDEMRPYLKGTADEFEVHQRCL